MTVDIAHYETTTAHTALYIGFFRGRGLATRPLLQKVSWDLFFGACHFCSFEIVDLTDFTPKNKDFYETNNIEIVYLLLFYSTESPVEAISLKPKGIKTLK